MVRLHTEKWLPITRSYPSRYLVSLSNSAAASDLTAALSETLTVNLGSDQLRKNCMH